jgi:hypothetical protein
MNIREILDKLTVLNKPLIEMNWQDIYDLNKDQIKNPNLIYPNQKFKMPGGGEYVVKPGDSLSKIAKQYVAKVDTAKKEPEKSDVDKQIEKDKTNPQNTPPKKDGQSGQTTPVEKPPAITVPPVKVSQNNYDTNRSVDVSEPNGFAWGKIRSKADRDYSTGDIGFKPDGSPGIRTPFQRNTQAMPQTGGSGFAGRDSELLQVLKNLGIATDPDTVVPTPANPNGSTTTTPSTTTPSTTTPSTTTPGTTTPGGSGQTPPPYNGTVVPPPQRRRQ